MRKIDEVYVMNYNDDDELERLRARNRRGTRRSPAAAGPGTGRQIPPSRNGKQDSRGHYDEEYYYDEEFGQEEYGREMCIRDSIKRDSSRQVVTFVEKLWVILYFIAHFYILF